MPDPLHPGRSVDIRSFGQGRIVAHQRRQIDDQAVSGALPDSHEPVYKPPPYGIAQEGNRRSSQGGYNIVHQTAGSENLAGNAGDDNPAEEVRQIQAQLRGLPDLVAGQLVQEDRKKDGEREAQNQVADVEDQRISQRFPEQGITEGFLKPLEPDPLHLPHGAPAEGRVFFEGHDNAQHGLVLETNDIDNGNQHHGIQLPSAGNIGLKPPFPVYRPQIGLF